MTCCICKAPAVTHGTMTPGPDWQRLLGVGPFTVMVFGLCAACCKPGFAEHVEAYILRDVMPTVGGVQ
jgi:hypothetical protein